MFTASFCFTSSVLIHAGPWFRLRFARAFSRGAWQRAGMSAPLCSRPGRAASLPPVAGGSRRPECARSPTDAPSYCRHLGRRPGGAGGRRGPRRGLCRCPGSVPHLDPTRASRASPGALSRAPTFRTPRKGGRPCAVTSFRSPTHPGRRVLLCTVLELAAARRPRGRVLTAVGLEPPSPGLRAGLPSPLRNSWEAAPTRLTELRDVAPLR